MSGSRFFTIYKKELVDTLRDRRTLATMLLVPMVGYPLALIATSETITIHQRQGAEREVHAVLAAPLPDDAVAALERSPKLRVRIEADTSSATEPLRHADTSTAARLEELRRLFAASDADVVILPDLGAPARLGADGTVNIGLYFDSTESWSEAAVTRVEDALSAWAVEVRDARMARLGVPPSTARPIRLERHTLSTGGEIGNQLAGSTLPALVLLFIAISCFYPAVDLTAGEKERKTLATLLTAPVRPLDIVFGKYLAVVTVGTLAGLLNVVVLGITLLRVFTASAEHTKAAFEIAPLTWVFLTASVLLIALPVAAMMLATATLARSFRDASNLLTPVLLLSTAPAVLSSLPGFELTSTFAVIPLANAALLMKALIAKKAAVHLAALVVLSTFVFTAAVLLFAARIFTDERVLFSTEGRRADLTATLVAPPPLALSTALVFASVVFIGNYYGGLLGDGAAPLGGLVATQLLAHVAPALVFAAWMRSRIAPVALLQLKAPAPRALGGAVVVGLGAWLAISMPAAWLSAALVPGQEEAAKALREVLGLDQLGLPLAIAAFAILPALAEELAFRGVLLSVLRRAATPTTAVVAQALVFGLMHGSVFRLLPTGLLGGLLGVIALRTGSIWPGVIAHALTNAILLSLDRSAPPAWLEALSSPTPLVLVGVALVWLGLWAAGVLRKNGGRPV